MYVTKVDVMQKGIAIEVVCDHGWYQYIINDGEPSWMKLDEDHQPGYKSFTGLNATRDKKLINKLNREWKTVKYTG